MQSTASGRSLPTQTLTITMSCRVQAIEGQIFILDDSGNRIPLHTGQQLHSGDHIVVVGGSVAFETEDHQTFILMSTDHVAVSAETLPEERDAKAIEAQKAAHTESDEEQVEDDNTAQQKDSIENEHNGIRMPFTCVLTAQEVEPGSGAETHEGFSQFFTEGQFGVLGVLTPDLMVYQPPQDSPALSFHGDSHFQHDSFRIPTGLLQPTTSGAVTATGPLTTTGPVHTGSTAHTHITLTLAGFAQHIIPPQAAHIGGNDTGRVTEDVQIQTHGTLTISDPNPGENHFMTTTQQGALGTFSLNSQGQWSFTANNNNPAIQSLGAGQSLTTTYTVQSADGTHHQVTIAINGTNDAPVLGQVTSQTVAEGDAALHGQLSATDPDTGDSLTFSSSTPVNGFSLKPDGSYTFNPQDHSYNHLAAGQTQVLSIPVSVTDSHGATVSQNLQITVTGTNDGPVMTAVPPQTVAEGDATVHGQLSATDPDTGDTITFTSSAPVSGFSMNSDGSYSFDPKDAAYNHLAVGQTEVVRIPVTVTDSAGVTATQNLEITVTGTNDAPVVSGATTLAPGTEDTAVTLHAADLLSHATDVDSTDTLSVANLHADHGKITSNPDGSFTFTPDKDYNGPVSLSYEVTDGHGGTVQTSATMNLAGIGDAAVITGTDTGDVTEDRISYGGLLRTHGQLTVTDPDSGEAVFVGDPVRVAYPTSLGGNASLVISPDGSWIYKGDNTNPRVQALKEGETLVDTVTVQTKDGTTHQIEITIHGTNDAPVLQAQSQSVIEDGSLLSGQMVATDVDTGDTQSFNAGAQVAGFNMKSDGSYTFDPTDPAYQHLAAGQTEKITVPVTVTDSQGATSTQNLEITVSGTNDAPVVTPITDHVDEDVASHSLDLLSGATDLEGDSLAVSGMQFTVNGTATSGPPPGVTIDADGHTLHIDTTGPAYQHLAAGQQEQIQVNYLVDDGKGGQTQQTATLTVEGQDDKATLVSNVIQMTETVAYESSMVGHSVKGHLQLTDPDDGSSHEFVFSGTYAGQGYAPGQFTVWPDGSYDFNLDWASNRHARDAVNSLKSGETLEYKYNIQTADHQTKEVVIRITGEDDAARITVDPILPAHQTITEDNFVPGGQGRNLYAGGILTVIDPDHDEAGVKSQNITTPEGGHFQINERGSWFFVIDNSLPVVQQLGAGETIVKTFTVESIDGSATHDIQVTIQGTNDAPVLQAQSQSVTEDGSLLSGQMVATDVDTGDTQNFSPGSQVAGFSMKSDGSYTFDPTDQAYQHLAEGQTEVIRIPVTVTDSAGATATQNLEITVTGTNDAPVVSGATTLAQGTEDTAVTLHAADLLSHATDVDSTDTLSVANLHADHGKVTSNPDGSFTFTPEKDYNGPVSLSYEVTDGHGGTVQTSATMNLAGVGDAAVITGTDTGDVTEDRISYGGLLRTHGQLTVTDPDSGEAVFVGDPVRVTYPTSLGGNASLVISPDGSWIYTGDNTNPRVQALKEGETLVDTVTVQTKDGTTHQIEITIHGTNDAPVLQAQSQSVTEDGSLLSGQMTATDVDSGDTLTFSSGQQIAGFTLNQDGSYTFDPTDQAYQHLGAGQPLPLQIPVTVTDSSGVQATSTLTVTVTGTNDTPVVAGAVILPGGPEDQTQVITQAQLLGQTSDVDTGDTLQVAGAPTADHGSFSANSDGTFTFHPEPDYNGPVAISYQVTDGKSPAVAATASMTLSAVGDAAVITGTDAGSLTEESHVTGTGQLEASGTLQVVDPDAGEDHFTTRSSVQGSGGYGTFSIDAQGHWTYTADNSQSAVQHLGTGASLTDTVQVTSADGTQHTVTVTIQGTNDAPVMQGQSQSVTEDGALLSGQMTATDVDTGDTQNFSPGTQVAGFIMKSDGSYTFDPTDQAYQHLAEGQTEVIRIPVTVTDSAGATATQNLEITVTGTNDAPVVSGTTDLGATDQGQSVTFTQAQLTAHATDIDGDAVTVSAVSVDPKAGSISHNQDGTFTFSPAPGFSGNNIPVSFSVTDGKATTQGTATVDVHQQVNHAPVINTGTFTSHTSGPNLVGTMTATDADKGDRQRWTVVTAGGGQGQSTHGQYGSFTIDANSGAFTYAPDGAGGQVQKSGTMPQAGAQVVDSFVVAVTDSQGLSHEMQVNVEVDTNARHVHGASGHWVAHIVPVGASLSAMSSHDEAITDPDMTDHDIDAQLTAVSEEIQNLEAQGKDSSQAQDKYDALMDHKSDLEGTEHPQEPVQETTHGTIDTEEVSVSLDSDQLTVTNGSPDQAASISEPESGGVESGAATGTLSATPDLSGLLSEEPPLNFDALSSSTSSSSTQQEPVSPAASVGPASSSHDSAADQSTTSDDHTDTHDSDHKDGEKPADGTPLAATDILQDGGDENIDPLLQGQPEKKPVPVPTEQATAGGDTPDDAKQPEEAHTTVDSSTLDSNLVDAPDEPDV